MKPIILPLVILSILLTITAPAFAGGETAGGERYQVIDGSIVLDTQTGLMWAARDNGENIDWDDANAYCEDFAAGGHSDWRLPEMEELKTLYTPNRTNSDGYHITGLISLSACCMWSSDTSMGGASIFSFASGKEPFGYFRDKNQLRALPVRDTEKAE